MIFSNLLLMYLTNEEIRDLFIRQLSWLHENGHMFFRESCFHSSGNSPRGVNSTEYRDPSVYNALFQSVSLPTEEGSGSYGFELVLSRSIQTYVKVCCRPSNWHEFTSGGFDINGYIV